MEIRELKKHDIKSLLELYVQLSPSNTALSSKITGKIWEEIKYNKNIKYLGAFDDDKLVASCFIVIVPNFTNHGKSIGYIENVITDIQYRRKGVGRKVVNKAIEIARNNNCYKVFLKSGASRTEAHIFYKSLGFEDKNKKAFNIRL